MGVVIKRNDTDMRNVRKTWVDMGDGTFFELKNKQNVQVTRWNRLVDKLPPGAKVVPKPAGWQHSPEELKNLEQMRADFDEMFGTDETNARKAVMAILDHPDLNFHQKMKRHWALRKTFKTAIMNKRMSSKLGDLDTFKPIAADLSPKVNKYIGWSRAKRREMMGKGLLSAMSIKEKSQHFVDSLDQMAQEDDCLEETAPTREAFRQILESPEITDKEKEDFFAHCEIRDMSVVHDDAKRMLALALTRATYKEVHGQDMPADQRIAGRESDGTRVPNVMHREPGFRVEATGSDYVSPESKAAVDDLVQWLKTTPNPVLQPNEHSRLHKLLECVEQVLGKGVAQDLIEPFVAQDLIEPFVVKHNWLGAFGKDIGEVKPEELRLPYPMCAFEFRVSGRAVTVIVTEREAGTEFSYQYFVEARNGFWAGFSDSEGAFRVMDLVRKQVEAICIMLDAKIAETETIRQPPKLQKKRLDTGKRPLFDYHVIDLSKRHKAGQRPKETSGIRQRCHLRRGHWMHAYERPKAEDKRAQGQQRWEPHSGIWRTWVNWYMAGDPDLGFVEHEYRL